MATDISLVNNVVKITIDSGRPRQYSLATATYAFNENDVLNLTIDGQNYSVALADLRINGAGSAPVSTAAALTSLSSVFPAWNQTTYTLNEILAESNDAGANTIDNLADPTTDQQAATKKYVDDNAGGGEGGALLSATVELTNAQIIALPSTGVELVAAQGSGKIINVVSCYCVTNFASVYTGTTDASLNLMMGLAYVNSTFPDWAGALETTTRKGLKLPENSYSAGGGSFAGETIGLMSTNLTNLEDEALVLKDDYSGLSDYGGGNAANTLKVTVFYTIVDL